ALPDAPGDAELSQIKRLYRKDFEAAFASAVRALSPRDRTLLRQWFADGVDLDGLSVIHKVHRATAARWLSAARKSLGTQMRKMLVERLQLRPGELDSLMRLLNSQLELSKRAFRD